MSQWPEITTEQIVARLRMIVAEPEAWCETDRQFVEDAADEIARLTAERDEARREICDWVSDGKQDPKEVAKRYRWDCFKEDGK